MAGDDFGRDLAFMHRLVGQHGLADDVADGEDVGHVGAHLLVHRDEAALVHGHAGGFGADGLAVGAAADGHQDPVEDLGLSRMSPAFRVTWMPSFFASMPVTPVLSLIASKRFSMRLCKGLTRSASQPG
jgi:hypothetical protein